MQKKVGEGGIPQLAAPTVGHLGVREAVGGALADMHSMQGSDTVLQDICPAPFLSQT